MIERMTRDHPLRIHIDEFKDISKQLSFVLNELRNCDDLESIRGWEGQAANSYNKIFNQMILQQKDDFYFASRTRRPPLDRVNAMLSFGYTLLENDTAYAFVNMGLVAYDGFIHVDCTGSP